MIWHKAAATITLTTAPAYHVCEPGWRWKKPRIDDFDLWVVLGGRGWINTGGEAFEVVRGQGVFFVEGDSVIGWHDPKRPLRAFSCHFEIGKKYREELTSEVPRRLNFHDVGPWEAIALDLARDFQQLTPPASGFSELRLAHLLALASRDASGEPHDPREKILRRICMEISSNPAASFLPSEYAYQCGLSLSQFNRRFRELTGASPARYTITRRVERARKLLQETVMTLQEISNALGYADIYYFHRQFRAETGTTPGKIREQLAQSRSRGISARPLSHSKKDTLP